MNTPTNVGMITVEPNAHIAVKAREIETMAIQIGDMLELLTEANDNNGTHGAVAIMKRCLQDVIEGLADEIKREAADYVLKPKEQPVPVAADKPAKKRKGR